MTDEAKAILADAKRISMTREEALNGLSVILGIKDYSHLRPVVGEEKYVDFDEDTGLWCVFGLISGFAYSTWSSEDQAQRHCN